MTQKILVKSRQDTIFGLDHKMEIEAGSKYDVYGYIKGKRVLIGFCYKKEGVLVFTDSVQITPDGFYTPEETENYNFRRFMT